MRPHWGKTCGKASFLSPILGMRRGKCQLQGAAPPPAWLLWRLWVPAPAQFVYGSSGEPCKILASSQLPLALFLPPVPLPCFLHFAGGKHGFPRIASVNKPRNKLESEAENKGRGRHLFSRQPLASAPCPVGNWPLHSSPCPHLPFPAAFSWHCSEHSFRGYLKSWQPCYSLQ